MPSVGVDASLVAAATAQAKLVNVQPEQVLQETRHILQGPDLAWRRTWEAMQRIKLAEVVTPDGRITQRTELAAEQKAIPNTLE